jgi:hypothetical protein
MDDFDLTLQLLRLGFQNRVSNEFCHSQVSHTPGGCSIYRTSAMQTESAHRLARYHPGFVRVVTRRCDERSSAWKGMKERHEVVVQWKKASMYLKSPATFGE